MEVLVQLAEGKQLKGIAFDMGISVKAVENHVTYLKSKLGAQTLSHLIAKAFRQGLLT